LILIKLGGAALKNCLGSTELFEILSQCKEPCMIVHGGGPEINALSQKLGIEAKFFEGQRITDSAHVEVVEMVLSGKVNSALVRAAIKCRIKAVGVKGCDDGLFLCTPEKSELGAVGAPTKLRTDFVKLLLDNQFFPIVSPVGFFADYSPCNVNADLAASSLASELHVDRLIFLTDRDGILDAQGETMTQLSRNHLESMLQNSSTISGGMKVKARAILETLAKIPNCDVSVMNGTNWEMLKESLLGGKKHGTRIE